jgi:Zn-dependent peptidase ImmA (M78 family)
VWGLGDGPLPNLVQLAESRGIRVLGLPKAAEAVDAFSVWSEGFPYVFVCRAKSPERARFDLAHEIGHLILHSRSGAVDSRKGVEREADQFASAFLMPDDSLKRTLRFNASISEILSARSYYGVSAFALNVALNRTWKANRLRVPRQLHQTCPDGLPITGTRRHEAI